MPPTPNKVRKQYTNTQFPDVMLRFEDGHEIHIPNATTKSFDAWEGERIKVLVVWDPTSGERERIETWRAEQFDDEARA